MDTLNIHPLFVHFPIAFLSLATVMELARSKPLMRQAWWLPMKALLLGIGVAWAFVAGSTGELAEAAYRGTETMKTVEMHSFFSGVATYAYLALAVAALLEWSRRADLASRFRPGAAAWLRKAEGLSARIFKAPVLVLVSLVAFAALLVTGALGASIVYGPDIDPVVKMIHSALVGG